MGDCPPSNEELIGYALNGAGTLVHISEVPRGKACECRCVACGESLIAKQGHVRVHHFAHAHESRCTGALETVLHRLAKDILREAQEFWVPPYFWRREQVVGDRTIAFDRRLFLGGRLPIDATEIEVERFEGVRPDALIHGTSPAGTRKQLLIEIAVRHRVDAAKLERLRKLGLPALEIQLAPELAWQPREVIRQAVLCGPHGRQWLFHPAELKVQRDFEREVAQAEAALQQREQAYRPYDLKARLRKVSRRTVPRKPGQQWEMARFIRFERRVSAFFRRHARLPTLEESRELVAAMERDDRSRR